MIKYKSHIGIKNLIIVFVFYFLLSLGFHYFFDETLLQSITSRPGLLIVMIFGFENVITISGNELKEKVFMFITNAKIDITKIQKIEIRLNSGIFGTLQKNYLTIYHGKYDSYNLRVKDKDMFINDLLKRNPNIQIINSPY